MGILSAMRDNGLIGIVLYLLAMVVMIFSVMPIHECSHALMAKILGDDTAQRAGRLTLNPLTHLNPTGALCMILVGFGWAEPVPVNPVRFNNQKRRQGYMALVAFAGPLSNLIMSFVWLLIYRTILCFDMSYQVYNCVSYLMSLLVFINVGLAVFNMLPIGQLDGGRIFNWLLPDKLLYKIENTVGRWMSNLNPVIYIIIFIVFINVISTPLGIFEGWLVNDVMLTGVDGIFNALGLGYGHLYY